MKKPYPLFISTKYFILVKFTLFAGQILSSIEPSGTRISC